MIITTCCTTSNLARLIAPNAASYLNILDMVLLLVFQVAIIITSAQYYPFTHVFQRSLFRLALTYVLIEIG